jgi:putative transposase
MPRANRHFLPGHVWHITHRCHQQEFLLKFAKDRSNWIKWLYEAKKRYGLCVLNYIVTSNHIHLLVKDTGENVIPRSLQLIAGRTAQHYNQRKKRKGAYWEDRYHATAIERDEHFFKCLVYIDLNMVRAGVVRHPREWKHSGYHEIQRPPQRYTILDLKVLQELDGLSNLGALHQAHREWVDEELRLDKCTRQAYWSEGVAVGSNDYVKEIQNALGARTPGRENIEQDALHVLKEPESLYQPFYS